jgi:hypothetical protein
MMDNSGSPQASQNSNTDKMMDNSGSPQASQNSNTDKMMDNSGSPQASQNSNTDVQIKFFKKGQITIISPSSPIFSLLKRECENLLVSSNNAIYELVIDEIIKNIKDNNIAIELIYNKIKEMKINNPAYKENKIAIDRILIPLSGYYGNGTIFYGYKHYSSGPFVNSMGTQKIKDILISAGIDTN